MRMANAMANANANVNANENEKYKTQFEREPIKCLQFILDTDLLCATHVYVMYACMCVCVFVCGLRNSLGLTFGQVLLATK